MNKQATFCLSGSLKSWITKQSIQHLRYWRPPLKLKINVEDLIQSVCGIVHLIWIRKIWVYISNRLNQLSQVTVTKDYNNILFCLSVHPAQSKLLFQGLNKILQSKGQESLNYTMSPKHFSPNKKVGASCLFVTDCSYDN